MPRRGVYGVRRGTRAVVSRGAGQRASTYTALRVALGVFAGAFQVSAQVHPAAPDAGTCNAELRQIANLEATQRSCEAQTLACTARADHTSNDLSAARRQIDELSASGAACQNARDQLCTTTGQIVGDVLELRSNLPAVEACVPAPRSHALGELLASWRNAHATLLRVEALSRGDIDAPLAAAGPVAGEVDALALRLAGGGREPPLVYRRLLVEAVRRLAPRYWRDLHATGPYAVDTWFAANTDLDAAFLTEAHAALGGRPDADAAGPEQSAALRFVQSYLDLVGCSRRRSIRGCARAEQLKTFLESSTAIIVRQRVHEIWNSPCESLSPEEILNWLREFPSPQPALSRSEWGGLTFASYSKLVSCYLSEADATDLHFSDWLARQMPTPSELTGRLVGPLDAVRTRAAPGTAEASCLDAARLLRELAIPTDCALPESVRSALETWFERRSAPNGTPEDLSLVACSAYVDALWHGHRPEVLESSPGVPSSDELVRIVPERVFAPTRVLRAHCNDRSGTYGLFPRSLQRVARVAAAAGEDVTTAPWRVTTSGSLPREAEPYARAMHPNAWIRYTLQDIDPCAALDLSDARCTSCMGSRGDNRYDCTLLARVTVRWQTWQRRVRDAVIGFITLLFALWWGLAMRRAIRRDGGWRRELTGHLRGLGLRVRRDPLRFVRPSRLPLVRVALPGGPWERWGLTLVVTRAETASQITERDVRTAALAARTYDGELAIVAHDEGASPSLPAVRAMLDWAAQSPRKAVQVLPVATERLRWARSTDDLLDLVEQVSLRGNPFEVRGRLISSSQFFNRERLVSGLLAGAQLGNWTVITGLRRFGKSSLALEVARRMHAPSAYVDLAGFHHELASGRDSAGAVNLIVRYVCRQLHASAEALYQRPTGLPEPPHDAALIEADFLASWFRTFLTACREANHGRPVTPLIIFDEIEQAIGVGAERVAHATEALAILVGRLRSSLSDGWVTQGGDRVGVIFCSAIHAILWAPLATLGQQSLLGAFPSVFVPVLPDDAAFSMMRGLGARQGIRFTDQALALIVREAQGIPILVRRIGSSVLELYDPERARQGSLGALEIGSEGASAAVRREQEDGAPLRVWVESEIGDPRSPVGGLLRFIARRGTVSVTELKTRAFEATEVHFREHGLEALLGHDEPQRRAHEAAGFLVRMLGEIGVLTPEGDVTQTHALTFPDSIVRRILASSESESPLGF